MGGRAAVAEEMALTMAAESANAEAELEAALQEARGEASRAAAERDEVSGMAWKMGAWSA